MMSVCLILEALERSYPDTEPELDFSSPYETLVATILSAQCTDKQVNKVTPAVFSRYPTLPDMAEAATDDLFQMVKSCGFKSKAQNIITSCRIIRAEYGGQVPDTLEELTKLPGVGRKTANVILAFVFGKAAIPVDTHVFRVANRIGLADSPSVFETEKQLCRAIPEEKWAKAHQWLIRHGRAVCKAHKPLCADCPLTAHCQKKL